MKVAAMKPSNPLPSLVADSIVLSLHTLSLPLGQDDEPREEGFSIWSYRFTFDAVFKFDAVFYLERLISRILAGLILPIVPWGGVEEEEVEDSSFLFQLEGGLEPLATTCREVDGLLLCAGSELVLTSF